MFVLIVVWVVGTAGCMDYGDDENRDRPGGPFYRMLDGTGDQVRVVDADGDSVAKLRDRNDSYKVYDADLSPAGYVQWSAQAAKAPDAGTDAIAIQLLGLSRDDSRPIERRDDGVWELAERFRVERTGKGWAVFAGDASLLGRFTRDDDRWTLTRETDGPEQLSVESGGSSLSVQDADGELLWRTTVGRVAEPVLLALALEELAPLERVAVGTLIEQLDRRQRDADGADDAGG